MALWNIDPFFDMGMGWPRDPWAVYRQDPLNRWMESSLPSVLSAIDFAPTGTRRRSPIREVVSDENKYQVKIPIVISRLFISILFNSIVFMKVTLHLGDFKSDEINVKLVDRNLVIHAEHKEKPDEHGHISRNIKRSYILPRNTDFDNLSATFSDDGSLVVCAQKKAMEPVGGN
jgi:HSP20 family molecular chaperone IbpA